MVAFGNWVQVIVEKAYASRSDHVVDALHLLTDLVALFVRVLIILMRNNEEKAANDRRKRRAN